MDIEKAFRHSIGLKADTVDVINIVEWRFVEIAKALDERLPESREKSLCMTKLQEAKMWACECMAKNEDTL